MTEIISRECPVHPDRRDCPDAIIEYISKFDEYGIIVHDGGSAISKISLRSTRAVEHRYIVQTRSQRARTSTTFGAVPCLRYL